MSETVQLCSFTVADLVCGIDIEHIQEVIVEHPITEVPLAPEVVEGLINLRGTVVTVVDLRKRLGIAPRPEGQSPSHVVVRHGGSIISLLVDEIGDVVDAAKADEEPPPRTLRESARAHVDRVYKLEGQLLLALDIARATSIDTSH